MRIKVDTLGTRVALAMMSSIMVGVFVLGIVFFFTYDYMEHKLLEMLDSYAVERLDDSYPTNLPPNKDGTLPQKFSTVKYTSGEYLPAEIKNLKTGFHHDIKLHERSYHIAVKKYDGKKNYLLFDITDIETQEHILNKVIVFSIVSVLILAIWITYWLSKKVIWPVRDFAEQMGKLDPTIRNVRMADKFDDVEVGLIARSFDRYMERLDGFVEREQSFTSTVSHELRTPLSVISTSVEILGTNQELPGNSTKYIDQIKNNANEMSNLINALLFLAREDQPSNQTPSEQTDVVQLSRNLIETCRYAEQRKDIALSVIADQELYINAPKSHLQIVISNLLNNAIRYTPKGKVEIYISNSSLNVIDTGSGIDPETLNRAFDRGFKGKESSGYGFGLYICKRICDRYGWTITMLKNQDIGSTATIKF